MSVLHTELFATGAHNGEYYARVLLAFLAFFDIVTL
jgi:hypothetical protein